MNATPNLATDFQQIFDAVPGLFLVLAPDSPRFTILAATDAYLLATLKQRGEIIGRALFDVFSDNSTVLGVSAAQSTRASLERAIDLGVPDTMALQRHDIALPKAQGGGFQERHWRALNSPVMNASGEVAYLIHRIEDVTEFVQTQQQASQQFTVAENLRHREGETETLLDANRSLRESRLATLNLMQDAVLARQQSEQSLIELKANQERLRLATDATDLGIWTWEPDSDRVIWENDRLCDILRMDWTDTPPTAARFAAKFVHAEDLPALKKALQDTAQDGMRLFYQCRFYGPDGDLRWVEFTGQAVPEMAGTPLRVIGTMRDITKRKQAEQLLALQAAELTSLYATAPVGLFLFDKNLRYVRINQTMAELNGLPAEQHIGRTLRELLAKGLADTVEPLLRQAIQTGQPVLNCEVQGATLPRSDEQRHWLMSCHPVRTGDGTITGVQGVVQEITERKKAQQALHESQRFLRSSLDALSGHIAVLDESGTILETNESWQRFTDENQLPGEPASGLGLGANYLAHFRQTLLQGGDAPAYALAIQDIIAGRRARFEMEYACHSPTEQHWFVMRVTRFQSAGPVRIVIVHDDCTERKLAENALRESEERYRNLFNSMDEGFCIVEIEFNDQAQAVDCHFLEVNPAFAVQTGMHGIAGKRLCEIAPDHQAEWLKTCAEVALTGKPIRFTHDEKSLDIKFENYAARLGGAESRKVAIVFNNITERAKAAEALRQSEQRFRALFDRGPVAMYLCDTFGIILEFNACAAKLWGRKPTPDDVDERFCGVSKVYRPDGALLTAAQNPMIAVLKGEIAQASEVEAIIERPDGSRVTIIANIVPLRDCQGNITGAINCFYDITERSRLERKTQDQARALTDQHRRKDVFLAMLSHELRNPLAPLTSAVELLRLQKNPDPVYNQACQVIERQVGQMKHLIDDLLEVSRITSGTVLLRKEPVRVGDIVEKALETAQPLILKRRHQLTVSLPPHPVWLDADATRLEQVLVNLLNNAAKYTDEGGHLWLSVVQEGDAGSTAGGAVAVITVRDTGMGIAAELLPHVFDLFTQAERAMDRSQGGMGIGLSLVRQLVELHGGTVEARSILGKGSEFVVRLPARQAAAPPLSLPPPVASTRPAGRRCRVLAVDDSVDAVEFLARLIRLSGHEVEVAYDGPSAVQAALAMRPDVVLLDIGLPGLTGYEVAKQLRQEPALKNTVLVALTGYGREADRKRSKNAGFSYHLVKPVGVREVEEILATVGEQLALQAGPAPAVVPGA